MFYVYGILCVIGLISMFAYLITLEVHAGYTDFLKSITNHKLMLMIYHYINTIINLSMLIATQGGFTMDVPRHCLEFTIFMFSIFDIIQSIIHFFISLALWCISRIIEFHKSGILSDGAYSDSEAVFNNLTPLQFHILFHV